jgi:hypothetical protein
MLYSFGNGLRGLTAFMFMIITSGKLHATGGNITCDVGMKSCGNLIYPSSLSEIATLCHSSPNNMGNTLALSYFRRLKDLHTVFNFPCTQDFMQSCAVVGNTTMLICCCTIVSVRRRSYVEPMRKNVSALPQQKPALG